MIDLPGPRLRASRPLIRLALALVAAALVLGCVTASTPPRVEAQTPDQALVDRVIASLTPDERVGQLVMVNFVGDDVGPTSDIAALIRDFKVGAVFIQASNGNIVNRDDTAGQLAALTDGLQQRAYDANQRADAAGGFFLPLMIATDNEGDLFPFTNITHNYTSIPNNMTIGATWNKQSAETAGKVVGSELSAAGVNMLLGPVIDVLDNPRSGGNGDIGIRSFGGNAAWVGEMGHAYVRGVHEGSDGRLLTIVKHFPGHGGSDRGTDNEVPTVNKSLDQLRALELAPFAEADRVDPNDPLGTTDGMMVSHIRYRSFVPGSAAPFTGPISIDADASQTLMSLPEFSAWRANHLVMADALGVPAIKKWYAQEEGQPDFPNRSVVKDALLAGNDLLPLVEFYRDPDKPGWKDNQLPTIQDSILYMREQYASDPDFRRRADDALRHVISAKIALYPQLQLAQVLVDPARATSIAGTNADAMVTIAEQALTLIQPQSIDELRARLPRGPVTPDKVVIVECWADCYPYRVMPKLALQDELLALYGPQGKARLRPEDVSTVSFGDLDAWLGAPSDPANAATAKTFADASWIIFALTEYNPVDRPVSGAAKRFLDAPPVDVRNKNVVAIAYNAPYHLDSTEISKLSAYFAVYNKTDAAIATSFHALFGDVTPRGHSPVNVGGIFYSVADAVQPAPGQTIKLSVYGQNADAVKDGRSLALVAGPIIDRNGNPVADGTLVSFSLTKSGAATVTVSGKTTDGLASATLAMSGAGAYTGSASVGTLASPPLEIATGGIAVPSPEPVTRPVPPSSSSDRTWLIIAASGVAAAVVLGGTGGGAIWYRRRRSAVAHNAPSAIVDAPPSPSTGTPAPPPVAAGPPLLRVDAETRRVYVKGVETQPPLSSEQFKLLSYLYQRAGKVVSRDELVQNVWPDAHAEGVSEEALDALVRRVRERIVQAGGERSYVATLRGQGFRLDV